MSNIGDAMGRLFGGPPATFRQQLTALKREHGTVTAAARALGIDRRTFQRWESGAIRHPRAASTDRVGSAYRSATARARPVPGDDTVSVAFSQRKKGGGERQRRVDGRHLDLRPGTMDAARRAYIAEGSEAAGAAFVAGIGDDWYHDLFEEDLTGEGMEADETASDPHPGSVSVS